MPRGPLPAADARRRNQKTIATRRLPSSGRSAPAPGVPAWIDLQASGLAWWEWSWTTPQAAAWTDSDAPFVARRASLEDDIAALEEIDGLDFTTLIDAENQAEIDRAIRRVAALATGRLQLFKEMRELDNRLGLNPKALIDLRWSIDDEETPASEAGEEGDADNVHVLYGA